MFNRIHHGDARDMSFIPDGVVDLVVTSPPYNVGIRYSTYDDDQPMDAYLEMLNQVWKECHRVLSPGGRIAINVAGTGRKPYMPLHHYIREQLERIGFGMRGEIIWNKGPIMRTAWGSWRSPANPALRDVHEYILVFSKGDWSIGHKGESDLTAEEFVEYTRSVWGFRAAGANQSPDHPAPFPLELPSRLIKLYTYKDDLVLDPFNGSGTTCKAAASLGRRWIGVDIDPEYCRIAGKGVEVDGIPRARDPSLTV